MASLFSHPAIPVALWLSQRKAHIKKLFILCVILSILPDVDVIGFKFGVAYESQWGHRGFTHSIAFALLMGFICQFFTIKLEASRLKIFCWTALSTLSHAVLDALTNGGLGVAFFWPLENSRYFFPMRPVSVSPLTIEKFFGEWGVRVLFSELCWIWLPVLIPTFITRRFRR